MLSRLVISYKYTKNDSGQKAFTQLVYDSQARLVLFNTGRGMPTTK